MIAPDEDALDAAFSEIGLMFRDCPPLRRQRAFCRESRELIRRGGSSKLQNRKSPSIFSKMSVLKRSKSHLSRTNTVTSRCGVTRLPSVTISSSVGGLDRLASFSRDSCIPETPFSPFPISESMPNMMNHHCDHCGMFNTIGVNQFDGGNDQPNHQGWLGIHAVAVDNPFMTHDNNNVVGKTSLPATNNVLVSDEEEEEESQSHAESYSGFVFSPPVSPSLRIFPDEPGFQLENSSSNDCNADPLNGNLSPPSFESLSCNNATLNCDATTIGESLNSTAPSNKPDRPYQPVVHFRAFNKRLDW